MFVRSTALSGLLIACFSQVAVGLPSVLPSQLGPEAALELGAAQVGQLATADINGDGATDFVVLDTARDLVVWETGGPLRAGGDPPTVIGIFASAGTLAVADLDSDGDEDVVMIGNTGGLTWFANPGRPEPWVATSLVSGVTPDPGFFSPISLRLADIDGNGHLDIAFVQGQNGSQPALNGVLLNTGQGVFQPVQPWLPAGTLGLRMVIEDLDGDGDQDAAAFGFLGRTVHVFRNEGAVPFTLVASLATWPTGFLRDLDLFDSDGDGRQDIIATTVGPDAVLAFRNLGGLQFAAPLPMFTPLTGSNGWRDTWIEDLTGDGEEDIVIGSSIPSQVSVWPGQGAGVFGPLTVIVGGANAEELQVLDVDGDGALDLVTLDFGILAQWFRHSPTGPLAFDPPTPIGRGVYFGTAVEVMDVDGDGDLDVILSNLLNDPLVWWSNEGGGRFLEPQPLSPAVIASTVAAGDLDGDGLEDVLVGRYGGLGLRSGWARNLGGGTFAAVASLELPGGILIDAKVIDLDGDGQRDLLAITDSSGATPGRVGWRRRNGASLDPFEEIDSQSRGFRFLAAVDLDLDGLTDVVASAGDTPSEVFWYRGRPGGNFDGASLVAATLPSFSTAGLELLDVDRDGHLDLVRAEAASSGRITWHAATAQGPAPGIGLASSSFSIELLPPADVNRDGWPDLISLELAMPTGNAAGRVIWRLLRSDGSTGPARIAGRGLTPGVGAVGDVDGDGDADLVVAGRNSGTVALFRGLRLGPVGEASCQDSVPTSDGVPARIDALGTSAVLENQLTLIAYDLPANAAGFFLTSQTLTPPMPVSGSAGELCLGGAIGRFVGTGQVGFSGLSRSLDLAVDLASVPTPGGLVQVLAGESWSFQAWFRDVVGGAASSNFTGAVTVTFE